MATHNDNILSDTTISECLNNSIQKTDELLNNIINECLENVANTDEKLNVCVQKLENTVSIENVKKNDDTIIDNNIVTNDIDNVTTDDDTDDDTDDVTTDDDIDDVTTDDDSDEGFLWSINNYFCFLMITSSIFIVGGIIILVQNMI